MGKERGPRRLRAPSAFARESGGLATLALRLPLGRLLLVGARARTEVVARVLAVSVVPGGLADGDRMAVVADHDLCPALALTGLAGLALAPEERVLVDPDVADEDCLLLVREEPAAVDDQLDAGYRPCAEQRQCARVGVALRAGCKLRRIPAARIVVADQVAAVDVRVRRTARERGRR